MLQPHALGHVVHRAIGKMQVTRKRAGRIQPDAAACGPAMHHRVGDIRVELETERMAKLKRLHGKSVAFGQQLGAPRQLKSFTVPMVDALRPVRAERMARFGRTDRIVAALDAAFRVRCDLRAQLLGEHLRAEANTKERPLLAQGDFDPVDFPANIFVGIVGAHRATKNDRAGMPIQRFRQCIAEPRTPDIEGMAEHAERIADPARGRGLLMQDDQDRQQRRRLGGEHDPPPRKGQDIVAIFVRPERHRRCLGHLKPKPYLSEY